MTSDKYNALSFSSPPLAVLLLTLYHFSDCLSSDFYQPLVYFAYICPERHIF